MAKYFWINNPAKAIEGYFVNFYGALNYLGIKEYKTIWLNFKEIEKILNLKTKEEKYSQCEKLFRKKFPQPKKEQKGLSKEECSKLEKLFA